MTIEYSLDIIVCIGIPKMIKIGASINARLTLVIVFINVCIINISADGDSESKGHQYHPQNQHSVYEEQKKSELAGIVDNAQSTVDTHMDKSKLEYHPGDASYHSYGGIEKTINEAEANVRKIRARSQSRVYDHLPQPPRPRTK